MRSKCGTEAARPYRLHRNRCAATRRSVQHARAQRSRDGGQRFFQGRRMFSRCGHVDHHIADAGIGLQVFGIDVSRVLAAKNGVF
jgi:hypothetical protein